MVGVHTLVDCNKVPNPKFLLFQEHFLYFFLRISFNIIQAVKDVKSDVSQRIIIIPAIVNKMLSYSTSSSFVFNMGFVVAQAGFPINC